MEVRLALWLHVCVQVCVVAKLTLYEHHVDSKDRQETCYISDVRLCTGLCMSHVGSSPVYTASQTLHSLTEAIQLSGH